MIVVYIQSFKFGYYLIFNFSYKMQKESWLLKKVITILKVILKSC